MYLSKLCHHSHVNNSNYVFLFFFTDIGEFRMVERYVAGWYRNEGFAVQRGLLDRCLGIQLWYVSFEVVQFGVCQIR